MTTWSAPLSRPVLGDVLRELAIGIRHKRWLALPAQVHPPALALCVLAGLALRLVGAQGGLWLDEAFSAVFAHEAGTPARVLFAINHDNNHHLNTLWLLAVGWGAPPLAARALSVATGTLAIVVAALFASRRSLRAGTLVAAVFAASPLLVTYGMEARGYAPMLLALLVALWLVDGWLADPTRPPPSRTLGLVAAIGVLSHLTFVYALKVIGGWAAWELTCRGISPLSRWERSLWAAWRWAELMGHAVLVAIAVVGIFWLAARLDPDGFRFGSYKSFSLADLFNGVRTMAIFAIGEPWPAPSLIVPAVGVATIAALRLVPGLGRHRSLYAIGILLLPAAIAAAHVGNADIPRYYLVSGVLLLLLLAEAADAAIATGGLSRLTAVTALGGMAIGAAAMDVAIATERRGDPGRATAFMQARAPGGASVLIDHERDVAVLAANAASWDYRSDIVTDPCARARFVFIAVERLPFPAEPRRCGSRYRAMASGYAYGLSGMHWRLYERIL